MPQIRGKTCLMLVLYRLLGLKGRHVVVDAHLHRPLEFEARLDLHSWLQRVAFLTGGYEADTVELLLDLHRRDGRNGALLDIGANIGLIAIPFAKSLKRSDIVAVAIEAAPDNAAILQRNVTTNGLTDVVKILPIGVGDVSRVVRLQVEGDLRKGEGTGTGNIMGDTSTWVCVTQEVTISTLDDLLHEGDLTTPCTVVKIDTDGYDLKALQGGVEFLARNRPVIFGEFSEHCLQWHGQSVTDVASFASRHGYEVWRRQDSRRFARYTADVDFQQDLLLVPCEFRAAFADLLEV